MYISIFALLDYENIADTQSSKIYLVWHRVVNGPTSSGPNPAQTRKYKPEPGPNPKTNLNPKSCPKKTKVKLGQKHLAMLPSYFNYIFVHLRQKVRVRLELSPKFLPTFGPNSTRIRARPEKPGPTYNPGLAQESIRIINISPNSTNLSPYFDCWSEMCYNSNQKKRLFSCHFFHSMILNRTYLLYFIRKVCFQRSLLKSLYSISNLEKSFNATINRSYLLLNINCF